MFHDAPEMLAVIDCESNFTHYKADGTVLTGRVTPDQGATQISPKHHPHVDAEDLFTNLAYARHLYDRNGTRDWVCAKLVLL